MCNQGDDFERECWGFTKKKKKKEQKNPHLAQSNLKHSDEIKWRLGGGAEEGQVHEMSFAEGEISQTMFAV